MPYPYPSPVTKIKETVRKRDKYRCTDCGMTNAAHKRKFGKALHVHRNNRCGSYSLDNCVTVCYTCHGKKRTFPNFIRLHELPWLRYLQVEISAELADDLRRYLMPRWQSKLKVLVENELRKAIDKIIKAQRAIKS